MDNDKCADCGNAWPCLCSITPKGYRPSADAACSRSDTPETDRAEHECVFDGQLLEVCRKLERERNEWKQHAWRESDMRERLVISLRELVTTNHESKEAFIARVAACLTDDDFAENS